MPTYVYKFTDTGETIEVQQAFTDPSLTAAIHPATGATMPVKKVFTPVGVTFKGGGFYKTDSRGGGSKASTPASGTSTADSNGSKADSSPAPSSSESSSGSGSGSSASKPAPAAAAASSAD